MATVRKLSQLLISTGALTSRGAYQGPFLPDQEKRVHSASVCVAEGKELFHQKYLQNTAADDAEGRLFVLHWKCRESIFTCNEGGTVVKKTEPIRKSQF